MTRKITISVPDEVAERLAQEPNVSAFVTEAVRRQVMQETMRARLESVGFRFDEGRLREARRVFEAKQAEMTPELKAWAREFIARHAPHRLNQMPAE